MKYAYPKQLRLLRPADFERVFAARFSAADAMMRMYATSNKLDHPRLGLTVSRKVGRAVDRAHWKRSIREAFRLAQHELPSLDIVCIPHRTATVDAARLNESLPKLARQLAARIESRQREGEP